LSNIKPEIETDFLWYFLISQYDAMRALASGNNQPNLNAQMIANLRIPLPPLAVQKEIIRRMAAGRAEIASEHQVAERLAKTITSEVEAMILGTKK
jgi:restriction endonuclease S subunit